MTVHWTVISRQDDSCFLAVKIGNANTMTSTEMWRPFLYKENHALDAWFKKAYGDE